MTADELVDVLIKWQAGEPAARYIIEDLAYALRSALREGVNPAFEGTIGRMIVKCNDAVREMPDD